MTKSVPLISIVSCLSMSCSRDLPIHESNGSTTTLEATETAADTEDEASAADDTESEDPTEGGVSMPNPHEQAEQAFPGQIGTVESFFIETPTGQAEVQYERINGYGVLDRDIIFFTPEDRHETDSVNGGRHQLPQPPHTPGALSSSAGYQAGAIRTDPSARWPNGTVPFSIAANLVNPGRVEQAIAHWEANTPIRFVPKTTEADYVEFVDGAGCSSFVGRRGGVQDITLAAECSTGNAIHEIGHAVGLWHEHARADRNSFVTVHSRNILPGFEHGFQTYVDRGFDGQDVGLYDLGSIMHYGSFAFSRNGSPTITRFGGTTFSAQRDSLSNGDVQSVNAMYPNAGPASVSSIPFFRVSDYTGDGIDDWSWWAPWTDEIITLVSHGDGNWTENHYSTLGWGNLDDLSLLRTGDYNGDGMEDISWWAPWADDFIVLISDGAGMFSDEWHLFTAGWGDLDDLPLLMVADYTGDGIDDWSWWAPWADTLVTVISHGDGSWTAHNTSTLGWGDLDDLPLFRTGDYNGDGMEDVSWWAPWSNDFIVLISDGGGTFSDDWHFSTAGWGDLDDLPLLMIADYTGDGIDDWSWWAPWSDMLVTVISHGDGSWTVHNTSTLGWGDFDDLPLFRTGDYNGDGMADVSWWASWSNDFIVLISAGGGTFSDEWHISTASWGDLDDLPDLTTADYNGDGRSDWSWWAPHANDFITMLSHGSGNWTEWHRSTAGWF